MSVSQDAEPKLCWVEVEIAGKVIAVLSDGRTVEFAVAKFPRLAGATLEQLRNWRLIGDGWGVHWPDVDEDLSVAGMLHDEHYRRSKNISF